MDHQMMELIFLLRKLLKLEKTFFIFKEKRKDVFLLEILVSRRQRRVTNWGSFYTSFNQLDGYDDLVVVDHFRSCFMAVRADLFNAVGGFDAKYNADGMGFRYETDLCMRVKNLAKKVVINPKIRIWHKVAKRSRGFERGKGNRYLFLVSRNHMYFMLKFFWHKHRWFWFVYDFLIGAYRTPGLLFLLKRRELSWANLVCVFRGKLSGLSFLK